MNYEELVQGKHLLPNVPEPSKNGRVYAEGYNEAIAECAEVAEEADREIAAKDQRIKELEEALQTTITAIANLTSPSDLDNYMDQETQEWIVGLVKEGGGD